jgi:hypothetical protein
MPAWLDKLRRRFSPARLRIGADGVRRLSDGGGPVVALVGRELCLFLPLDAARVPERQRAGFVNLAVRRAAPFPDPEHEVLWQGNHAAVWYWSRSRVRALAGTDAADVARYRAEAVFLGGLRDGSRAELLRIRDEAAMPGEALAIEGRVWRDGRLTASRWWPDVPDAAAWSTFVRGAGLDAWPALPEPETVAAGPAPLSAGGLPRGSIANLKEWRSRVPLLAPVAGTLAAAVLAWQLGGLIRAAWEVRVVEQRIARVSTRLEPVIAARERADAAARRIERALALRPPASQTRLLAEIKRITPGDWQLKLWHQPSPDVLEVTLRTANPDTPAIVSAWEQSPLLRDVAPTASAQQNELTLQARLAPWSEQAP